MGCRRGAGATCGVLILRHGECLGNVDESAYTRIPDHALPLTARGEAQATAAGPRIKGWSATRGSACTSARTAAPCARSPCWGSTRCGPCRSRGCASRTGATCRTPTSSAASREERDFFGHFFYRLPNGESGADVDDRIAAFLTELRLAPPDADALLVVTHGLAMRLLARRAMGWSVALFEALSNPEPCEDRVLTLDGAGGASTARSRSGESPTTGRDSSRAGRTPRAPTPPGW